MIFEKRKLKSIIILLLSLSSIIITGCSNSDDVAPAKTFSATISDIQIKRTADQYEIPVAIPSQESAVITVQ